MVKEIIDGIYYEDGAPKHAGIVDVDGSLYYAGENGQIAVGHKIVHGTMTNGLVKRGTYIFDKDGKLIKGSYVAPIKEKKNSGKSSEKRSKKRSKKQEKYAIIAAIAVIVVLFAVLVASYFVQKSADNSVDIEDTSDKPTFVPPEFDGDVYLCSYPLEQYYKGEYTLEKAVRERQGAYAPLQFDYCLNGVSSAVLELDGNKYILVQGESPLLIDNLMTGKTYTYKVTTDDPDNEGEILVYNGEFTVADTNRFITLPGLENTRDIGGYDTSYGKKIRQGLVIRGTEIDGLVVTKYFLTDTEAVKPFGFKCDFDLRSHRIFTGNYKSRLGDDVKHKFYDAPLFGYIYSKDYREQLLEVFADLADPTNYPMYLHCTYGTDRTGTSVFLLQGILGVSEEDMVFEYALTDFSMPGFDEDDWLNGIIGGLDSYEGNTINERIESFLISAGVTEKQIESIRNILLED